MGLDEFVASAAYQPEPTAVAAARRFVRDTLHEWIVTGTAADGRGVVDDAVLLTSELVTNAVVHAGTPVQVICRLTDDEVEVVVTDADPAGLVPEPRSGDYVPAERTSGRGLLLPAALASAWGVTYGRAAKAVWFRLGLSGQGDGASAEAIDGQGPDGNRGGALTDSAALAAALRIAPSARNGTSAATSVPAGRERHWLAHPVGAPGYDELLAAAADAARGIAGADAAYVLMTDEDGELRLRCAVGAMPGHHDDPRAGDQDQPGMNLSVARAVADSAPSVVTVPFVVDGRVTGLLAAASASAGRFGDDEAARLQRVADRWGPSLERARLAEIERVRRVRLGALFDARGLLAAKIGRNEAMALAAKAAVPRLTHWCAVLLVQDKVLRTAFARHADEARSPALGWLLDRAGATGSGAGAGVPAPRAASGVAAAWRWPLNVPDLDGAPDEVQDLLADDAWCFPLAAEHGPGVFVIGHRRQERLPREVAQLAADLACRIGAALNGGVKAAGRKR